MPESASPKLLKRPKKQLGHGLTLTSSVSVRSLSSGLGYAATDAR